MKIRLSEDKKLVAEIKQKLKDNNDIDKLVKVLNAPVLNKMKLTLSNPAPAQTAKTPSSTTVKISSSVTASSSPFLKNLSTNFCHKLKMNVSGVRRIVSTVKDSATLFEKLSAVLFATVFGVISPKVKTARVITTVETVAATASFSM